MNKQYKLSFTSNSLNLEETIKIAKIYSESRDWDVTKKIVLEDNILKRNKELTVTREFRELKHRLNNLTDPQLELLLDGDIETQKLIALLAVCKTYLFIKEFIVEVVRNKFVLFQTVIYESDYVNFYGSKAVVYDKLNAIKDSTKQKIRSVLFTIIAQAGLINSVKDKMIVQPFLLPRLIEVVVIENPELLKVFLVPDSDIKNYAIKYA